MEPLVSVCCATYNHERYIESALDGMLRQRADFPFEILVHDDCSTDGTQAILRRYAQRYPGVVLPLLQTENQYSKGVPINETFNFPRARGRYIALCEGDDYWTDENKLSRQIAYLTAHTDCTFCFTNATIHDTRGERADRPFLPYYPEDAASYSDESRSYDLGQIAGLRFLPTASFVFPVSALKSVPDALWRKECLTGDMRYKLLLTAAGYAYYQRESTCVYRENVSGSALQLWGGENRALNHRRAQKVLDMLDDVDAFSGGRYREALRPCRDRYARIALLNAPDPRALLDADNRRVYRALPLRERGRFWLKQLVPDSAVQRVRRLLADGADKRGAKGSEKS